VAAWTTTPHDATAMGALTAAIWDATVRDGFNAFGALTSYTPTLTGFTPGNGTALGAYAQIQKMVYFEAQFTFGTTTAAASANPTLTLPVSASTAFNNPGNLTGFFIDTGTATYRAIAYVNSSTTAVVRIDGTNGLASTPSTTSPFTWTTGDIVKVSGIYWAA
jgi:hypothetical protein